MASIAVRSKPQREVLCLCCLSHVPRCGVTLTSNHLTSLVQFAVVKVEHNRLGDQRGLCPACRPVAILGGKALAGFSFRCTVSEAGDSLSLIVIEFIRWIFTFFGSSRATTCTELRTKRWKTLHKLRSDCNSVSFVGSVILESPSIVFCDTSSCPW